VKEVFNLYRRNDLRSAGTGSYSLLTGCPLCEGPSSSPLPTLPAFAATLLQFVPWLAGASPDLEHVLFESRFNLTGDAPAQSPVCGMETFVNALICAPRLYEWEDGTVRLAGVLPGEVAADASEAGTGASHQTLTPHTISDGTDGHSRVFFTQPTTESGQTVSELGSFGFGFSGAPEVGNLFMRVDHSETVKLNVPEAGVTSEFAPAKYLDASSNGERVFFMTSQALTGDATQNGAQNIYMYDTTKPAGEHLTLLSKDEEPVDGGNALGLAGVSEDGHYVYMITSGQLLKGNPVFGVYLYLWHDGEVRYIGSLPDGSVAPNITGGPSKWALTLRESSVTPDGHHFVFTTIDGSGLGGYDQGTCQSSAGNGCQEVYVYDADTNRVQCASCNPTGQTAITNASVVTSSGEHGTNQGGMGPTTHLNRGISDDGELVFFSTREALVPQDTNGKSDAYEYNTRTKQVSLVSTGTDPADTWYVESSADGRDVFLVTDQALTGWDTDDSYDLYDARAGGGFPEPLPVAPVCAAGTCRSSGGSASSLLAPVTVGIEGAGNVVPAPTAKAVSRAERLRQALRACDQRRRRVRHRCEAAARKRFGKPASKVGRGK
jgi:hypothetical protein